MQRRAPVTVSGPVQLCFSVEQHVCALFALELLLDIRLPDGGHRGVVEVKPVATLLTDRKTGREKKASKHSQDLLQEHAGRKSYVLIVLPFRTPLGFYFSL